MILAGITLNVTLGQNGIFQKSKEAVDKYKEAAQREQAMLDNLYGEMSGYFVAKEQTETIDGKRIEELTTAKEKSQNPVIPKGYSAVQTETASWITETGRTEITDTLPTGTSFREPGYLSYYDSNQTYYGTGEARSRF